MDKDLTAIDLKIPKNYFGRAVSNLQLGGIAIHGIKHTILKYFYYAYSTFLLVVFVYFYTAAEIIHICKSLNIEDLLFTVSYLVGHVMGCAKITVLLVKRKSISKFLQSLEQGKFLPNIDRGGLQEISLIKQAVSKNTIQFRAWWTIVFVMLSNRMIWVAMNPTLDITSENPNMTITMRQLPYATSYLISFDMQKTPFYELVFTHQCISIWIFGWYMGNADTITNGLIIHLTAQFKIVANAFVTVAKNAEKLTNKGGSEKQIKATRKVKIIHENCVGKRIVAVDEIKKYKGQLLKNVKKCLRDCIQHHQDTLNLAEIMEDTFNMMFLILLVGCLVLYGIQLYQLSLLPVTSTAFISMSFFFFAMILQLSLFCWNGNELSIASEAIADAAYNTEWILADKTVKTLILLTILRAQRPVYITAGKFSTLSMATFATILRASLSYFTVLRKVNDVEE